MSLAGQRYAKRRDVNEPAIVTALERAGCLVLRQDVPCDLLVGSRGRWLLIEVKDGEKPPSARMLTGMQALFAQDCQGHKLPFAVVTTPEEALLAVGVAK